MTKSQRSNPSGGWNADDRWVLVLNQYALPRERGGGTRHVDLFSRIRGWLPLIVAGSRDHYTQEVFHTDDARFRLVWVPPYAGNGAARIVGWATYALQAVAIGLTRRRIDVVYASSPSMLAPVAGWFVARLRRVPLVLEVRDLWPASIVAAGALRDGSALHRLLEALERWLARRADHVVVVTPGWEEHFAALGVDASQLTVVPNGAEPSDFNIETGRNDLRRREGINRFTAVFAGAHGAKDGIDYILDAAAALPDIDFLLVGAGAVKQQARERACRQSLANVEFRQPVPKSQLPCLFAACDIGIHAVTPLAVFDKGLSPNKLFDYMSAGLPVVSNAAEALASVMTDRECGRLGGPDDLAECLRAVQQASEQQRELWGRRGRDIVSMRYSRSAAALQLRGVLEDIRRHGQSERTRNPS